MFDLSWIDDLLQFKSGAHCYGKPGCRKSMPRPVTSATEVIETIRPGGEEPTPVTEADQAEWEAQLAKPGAGKQAIIAYTKSSHWNVMLRNGDVPEKDQKRIDAAAATLRRSRAPHAMIVHRGITRAPELEAMFDRGEIAPGTRIVDPAFLSTSTTPRVSFVAVAAIHVIIGVPKGTPGAGIRSISHHPGESEFLMPPGTPLRVTGTYHDTSRDIRVIVAEVEQ